MFCLPFIGIAQSVFKSIERGVNSSEHNFKADLIAKLKEMGVEPAQLQKIMSVLNQGRDQDIGTKLNAMLQAGILPAESAELLAPLAQQNGVPKSSIDQDRIGESVPREESRRLLGGVFAHELDESDNAEDQLTALDNSDLVQKDW